MYPLSNSYPASDYTNPVSLMGSLGSFWNQIFNEKATLTGYTIGLAEELAQMYYQLADTINAYSIDDVPLFNKEKWYPLIIKQSQYNQTPLLFDPNQSYFGPQPAADVFYQNLTFQFGKTRVPSEQIYAVEVPTSFGNFYSIANRVISPSALFVKNIDVILQNNTLYFNSNLFSNPCITQYPIIEDSGVPSTFVNALGSTVPDTYIVLWVYHAQIDDNNLTDNFGYVYNLTLPSTEASKQLLKAIMGLAVTGPTIQAFKTMLAAAAGIPAIIETTETVSYVGADKFSTLVVTNANVYRYNSILTLLPSVKVGAVFNAGDILVTAIQYYDSSVLPNWWETVFQNYKVVPMSSDIFLGNYNYQLIFKNTLDLFTMSASGTLNFPVEGTPADVATFNAYINEPANQAAIVAAMGFVSSTNPAVNKTVIPIVPIHFLFENFFKDNMALIQVSLPDPDTTAAFFEYFESIRDMLPAHVFIMFNLNLNIPVDSYNNLNGKYTIPALSGQIFNADGSNTAGNLVYQSPYYYTNLPIQLFTLGFSPIKSGALLSATANLDSMHSNGPTSGARAVSGKVFTQIPSGATTATIRTLNIIDFATPYA